MKKFTALLLAVLMTATVFTGCGNIDKGESEAQKSATTTTQSSDNSTAEGVTVTTTTASATEKPIVTTTATTSAKTKTETTSDTEVTTAKSKASTEKNATPVVTSKPVQTQTPVKTTKKATTTTKKVTTKAPAKTTTTKTPQTDNNNDDIQAHPVGNFDYESMQYLVDSSAQVVWEFQGADWVRTINGGKRWQKFNEAWAMEINKDNGIHLSLGYARVCTSKWADCDIVYIPTHWTVEDAYNNYGLDFSDCNYMYAGTYVDMAGDGYYTSFRFW